MSKDAMKLGNDPNAVNNLPEEFGDAFAAGRIWQQMCDGVIHIKPRSVRPEAVPFIIEIATGADYEWERTDLEDGLVDLVLTRVG